MRQRARRLVVAATIGAVFAMSVGPAANATTSLEHQAAALVDSADAAEVARLLAEIPVSEPAAQQAVDAVQGDFRLSEVMRDWFTNTPGHVLIGDSPDVAAWNNIFATGSYRAVADGYLQLLDDPDFVALVDEQVPTLTIAASFPPDIIGKIGKAIGYGVAMVAVGAAGVAGAAACGATVVCGVAVAGGMFAGLLSTTLLAANDFADDAPRDVNDAIHFVDPPCVVSPTAPPGDRVCVY